MRSMSSTNAVTHAHGEALYVKVRLGLPHATQKQPHSPQSPPHFTPRSSAVSYLDALNGVALLWGGREASVHGHTPTQASRLPQVGSLDATVGERRA